MKNNLLKAGRTMSEVSLRPLSLTDTNSIVRWRNSPSVKKNLYTQSELTPEQHIQYFNNVVLTGKCSQFIIEIDTVYGKKSIGTIFLKNIDLYNRCGEYGIFIGDDQERGKGYAKLATKQILRYGFEKLHLHRVYLTVMADNYPAIRAYENAGFIREGIEREAYLRGEEYVDIVYMAILEEEWKKQNL